MARTTLTPQQVTRAGLTPAYTPANADGHSIPNSGREMLHVKTVGTGCTVTLRATQTVDGQAVTNRTVVIGTNSERMIGPFPPNVYDNGGSVGIDFSAVTAVTVAAIRIS